jgi:two-component system sensor histidine kinase BaeS
VRGFGCLFGVLLLVAGSAVVVVVSVVLSAVGLVTGGRPPGLLHLAAFVVIVVGLLVVGAAARLVGGTARILDDIVAATRRVEAGDYDVRVDPPATGARPVRDLVQGFNTMTTRLAADAQQRRRLLADVSHELRTPLAVVQGSLEALLDGIHPPDEAHVRPILEETRVLARLVEDLRTLALSDAGTLALHPEPTDLAVLADEAAATFRHIAEARGVTLAVDVDDALPLLDIDPLRIREVLSNLVANALRYTPEGGRIRVTARSDDAAGEAVVMVADTGAGIAPDVIDHVFDRFAKSSESRGSGLGLAIARSLVEAHGGRIRAESDAEQGTTIEFRLPLTG